MKMTLTLVLRMFQVMAGCGALGLFLLSVGSASPLSPMAEPLGVLGGILLLGVALVLSPRHKREGACVRGHGGA